MHPASNRPSNRFQPLPSELETGRNRAIPTAFQALPSGSNGGNEAFWSRARACVERITTTSKNKDVASLFTEAKTGKTVAEILDGIAARNGFTPASEITRRAFGDCRLSAPGSPEKLDI